MACLQSRCAALLVLAQAALFAAPDAKELQATLEKSLGGREGAIILLSLPEGRVLHEHGGAVLARKFHGCSVYKPLTAYALLKEGLVKPEETVTSSRKIAVGRYGVTLVSPYEEPGQPLDLARALAVSANSYFYVMGARIETERLVGYYQQMGLEGCVTPPVTPEEKAAFPAHGGKNVSASARDLKPYLIRLATDPSEEMAAVRRDLRLAVREGTGRAADVEGMDVCGKTGWLNGCGMFVAFAPEQKPSLGIVVVLPGGTGAEAAAVAGQVLREGTAGGTLPPPQDGATSPPEARRG
jgi:cell division protein FtsI/penicillin-binding protein 2